MIPSWEEVKPEDRDKKILHIDPGTAFGTGMHETTRLCIGEIKKYLTPETELLDVLVPLTPVAVNCLKPGGVYITSGIIENKEETVRQAVEAAGLTVHEVNHLGEWVSVTARKN